MRISRFSITATAALVAVVALVVGLGAPRIVSAVDSRAAGFEPRNPTRIVDTRTGIGHTGKVAAGQTINVTIPNGGTAAALNITVTEPEGAGFITAWPTGQARPNASSVNYVEGQTVPNFSIVGVGSASQVSFYSLASTHLIVDLTGTFTEGSGVPGPPGAPEFTASVTFYEPVPSLGQTRVSGTATNNTAAQVTIGIDLQGPTGETKTTYASDVGPGQTASWVTYFEGQFTSGVTVLRAYKAF